MDEPVPSPGFADRPGFPEAAADYRWLLDRGYPVPGSLKLAGDRYALDKDARAILFRGVLSAADSAAGLERRAERPAPGVALAVDGYCVCLTVFHFRRGRPLFVATDGFVRDAGGSHGNILDEDLFADCLATVARALGELRPGRVDVVFDAPVSRSAGHARLMRETLAAAELEGSARLEASADAALAAVGTGLVATSDSALVRRCAVPAFDLARRTIESRYGARLPDLGDLLAGGT